MFKFLKDKLSKAVGAFSEKVEEEAQDVEPQEVESQQAEEAEQKPEEPAKEEKAEPKEKEVDDKLTGQPETGKKAQESARAEATEEGESKKKLTEGAEKPAEAKPKSADDAEQKLEESAKKEVSGPKAESKAKVAEAPDEVSEPTEAKPAGAPEKATEKQEPAKPEEEKASEAKEGFFGRIRKRFTKEKPEEPQEPEPVEKLRPAPEEEKVEKKSAQEEQPAAKPEEETDQDTSEMPEDTGKTQEKDIEAESPADEKGTAKEKQTFFSRIKQSVTYKRISKDKFNDLFWDLEIALLENNVALEVIEKIKADLEAELVEQPIPRNRIESTILDTLKGSISDLFDTGSFSLMEKLEAKKPYVICFVGVNGSGKTTTIAKFANMLKENGKSVVLAAADTFRAAAIDQLSTHADRLGVKVIKHDYGSDAAAVAYDAIEHAKGKNKDVVLIDTAGRLHSNSNLMDELKKVIRVAKPDLKVFVGEAITGNDCVEQAKKFNDSVGIDAIALTKADIDEKGGASVSISYVTKRPILFIGTGQEYGDLEPFDKEKALGALGLA